MKNVLKRGLLSCAVAAFVAASSFAGFEAKAQEERNPWQKECGTDRRTNKNVCLTYMRLFTNTGQPLADFAIYDNEGEARKNVRMSVPVGVLLQPGLRVQIDDGKPIQAKYSICAPNACFAELAVDETFVNALKQGSEIVLTPYNQQAQEIKFNLTLIGFTAAYDGAAMTAEEKKKREDEVRAILQSRADEARQRLIDAQQNQ